MTGLSSQTPASHQLHRSLFSGIASELSLLAMGVDHGVTGGQVRTGGQVPPPRIWSGGIVPPDFVMLQNIKHQITSLQCRKMCFLPLQHDFYGKSRHAPPEFQSDLRLCFSPFIFFS